MRSTFLLAAAAIALAAPPAASATTVTNDGGTLRVVAGAGFENYLDLYESGGAIIVRDYANEDPVVPAEGSGCESDGEYRVICSGEYTARYLDGGDRDDEVRIYDLALPGTVLGGAGDDDVEFFPESAAEGRLEGGPGDDDLDGGDGQTLLLGGDGSDSLYDSSDEGDTFDGGAGADTEFYGGAGNDTFRGGPGADVFNELYEAGNDVYEGGAGLDEIDYSAFDEDLVVTQNGAADDGPGGGFPSDNVGGDIEQIRGGRGDDTLTGTDGPSNLIGNGGRDTLNGAGGDDWLLGDGQLAILIGGGGGAGDVLNGGEGRDDLNGDVGEDVLDGGAGEDSLDGGVEPDVLSGGDGVDTVDYDFADVAPDPLLCLLSEGAVGCEGSTVSPVVATIDGVADDGPRGEGDDLRTDVENVMTGTGADRVVGSAAANMVDVGGGDDTVDVRDDSADFVSCGPGFDRLVADLRDSFETSGEGRCETVDVPPAPQQPKPDEPVRPAIVRTQPAALLATVTPGIDLSGPRVFTTRGRLIPPSAMASREACSAPGGLVSVQVKARGTTISTRRAALKPDCTFRSTVAFRIPARFAKATRLKFTARFLGNTRLLRLAAKPAYARVNR